MIRNLTFNNEMMTFAQDTKMDSAEVLHSNINLISVLKTEWVRDGLCRDRLGRVDRLDETV
jgi:hypothetical protein